VDQHTSRWVCPEALFPTTANNSDSDCYKVVVFVGEFLQVFTRKFYNAAVHRVMYSDSNNNNNSSSNTNTNNHNSNHSNSNNNNYDHSNSSNSNNNILNQTRVSCPYILRGVHSRIIDARNTERYTHPCFVKALQNPSPSQSQSPSPSHPQQPQPHSISPETKALREAEAGRVLDEKLPDLDGMAMKALHKLLDLKRQKW
jgi:hypothetical protein